VLFVIEGLCSVHIPLIVEQRNDVFGGGRVTPDAKRDRRRKRTSSDQNFPPADQRHKVSHANRHRVTSTTHRRKHS
jgi:hypothetical protein